MRLTADGQVRTCLFAREESDLRSLLRGGADDATIAPMINWRLYGVPLAAMADISPGQSAWSDRMKPRSTARRRHAPRSCIQPLAKASL